MKSTLVFLVLLVISLNLKAQKLSLGAGGGAQVSGFGNGVARPGWRAHAIGAYRFNRVSIAEQIGVTVDNCSPSIPMFTNHSKWRYNWVDATSIVSYFPVKKQKFDVGLGSGVSVRYNTSNTVNGVADPMANYDSKIRKWSYFMPFRIGMDYRLAKGQVLNFALEYQFQMRDMYEAVTPEIEHPYNDYVSRLQSFNISAAYLFSLK